MDEANMEADGGQQERQAKNEKRGKPIHQKPIATQSRNLFISARKRSTPTRPSRGCASLRTMLWMPLMSRPVR